MSLVIAVISASLAGSFLCSLCEAALYGITPTQVEVLRRGRIPGSDRLAMLRRRIDEPIAGIAAFNSLAQTVGAAWAGALVGELYGNAWLGAFSAAFALTMLLLTEIVPKGVGLAWAGALAPRLAWVIQGMGVAGLPAGRIVPLADTHDHSPRGRPTTDRRRSSRHGRPGGPGRDDTAGRTAVGGKRLAAEQRNRASIDDSARGCVLAVGQPAP